MKYTAKRSDIIEGAWLQVAVDAKQNHTADVYAARVSFEFFYGCQLNDEQTALFTTTYERAWSLVEERIARRL